MKTQHPENNRCPLIAMVCLVLIGCIAGTLMEASAADLFTPVRQQLIKDGLNPRQVALAYQPSPSLQFRIVALTMRIREGRLNYDQFLSPASVAKAQRFLDTYDSAFAKAEEAYHVDPRVIAAILLVETSFGAYTGQTSALAVFSTFALMDQTSYRDKIWIMLPARDRERWGREDFDKKLQDRAKWAYGELHALFEWSDAQGIRPQNFRGSVMGAVGMPQFLPSSLIRYGADGNDDGLIDPYNPYDAIFSVGNYLRANGWCNARTESEKESVVYTYNHSGPYCRTILGVAARLRY